MSSRGLVRDKSRRNQEEFVLLCEGVLCEGRCKSDLIPPCQVISGLSRNNVFEDQNGARDVKQRLPTDSPPLLDIRLFSAHLLCLYSA